MRFGNSSAFLCITKTGAMPSMPLRSDVDVQASVAKSFASNGRSYDGGWENHDQIMRDLIRYCLKNESKSQIAYDQLLDKNFCQQAQRNLDLLKEICPIR